MTPESQVLVIFTLGYLTGMISTLLAFWLIFGFNRSKHSVKTKTEKEVIETKAYDSWYDE